MKKRWVTVTACLIAQLLVGILYLWSIFNEPVQAYYGLSKSTASMVQSVMMFGFVSGNLLGGYLQDRTNPRLIALIGLVLFGGGILITAFIKGAAWLIFVTYGVVSGIGCGFTYGSVLSCLQKWFPTRRGFASGLSVAAFGLSTVVFTPVAQALMRAFGGDMKLTFLTLSLIFIVVGVVVCLFIRLPSGEQKVALNGLTPIKAIKEPRFWLIAMTLFLINATWNIVCPVIKNMGVERGLSESSAALLVMLTGVFSAVGRLSMATVSDKVGRTLTVTLLAFLTMGSALLLIFASSYGYFAVILTVAFAYGGPSATLPAMTTDLCGAKYSGTNYGMAMLWLGISSVVFNAVTGAVVEATGEYTVSFVIAAATAFITAGLMGLYALITKKANAHKAAETIFSDKEAATAKEAKQ